MKKTGNKKLRKINKTQLFEFLVNKDALHLTQINSQEFVSEIKYFYVLKCVAEHSR